MGAGSVLIGCLILAGWKDVLGSDSEGVFRMDRTNTVSLVQRARFVPVHGPELKSQLPTCALAHPERDGAWMVLEQKTGRVWLIETESGKGARTVFAELGDGTAFGPWEGFLCISAHPEFKSNRRLFVKRDVLVGERRSTRVEEWLVDSDGLKVVGGRPKIVLEVPVASENHHGGTIAFGRDGMLYVGMGDGGPQEDPNGHAQDPTSLLGKMLRIDVDRISVGRTYGVPGDNPFLRVRGGFRPEIWAVGFREPWRFSFDRETGDLWVGDVGQLKHEKVAVVRAGENHGWNVFEGPAGFSDRRRSEGVQYRFPVLSYGREFGVSITGGYVYRGGLNSTFRGTYIFADYVRRTVWGLRRSADGAVTVRILGDAPEPVVSFAEDRKGEIFVLGQLGILYRLVLDGLEWR